MTLYLNLWWLCLFTETNPSFWTTEADEYSRAVVTWDRESGTAGVWLFSQVYYSKAAEGLKELSNSLMHTCQYVIQCEPNLNINIFFFRSVQTSSCFYVRYSSWPKLAYCTYYQQREFMCVKQLSGGRVKEANLIISTDRIPHFRYRFSHSFVSLLCCVLHVCTHTDTPMCRYKYASESAREIQNTYAKRRWHTNWLTYRSCPLKTTCLYICSF